MEDLTEDYKKLYELYKKFGAREDLNIVFYSINQPVPYKKLLIYPIKTVYYMFFHSLAQCFFVSKYDSGIGECMGMNPLEFLFYQNKEKNIDNANMWLPQLEILLLMCLKKDEFLDTEKQNKTVEFFMREVKHNNKIIKKYFIRIENEEYNWEDFEKIRDIICEQNCIELVDYKIHPDIRKKIQEKEKLLAKINKRKIGSFEELIDCLMLAGHYSEEYILNLSIRRFTNLLKRYDIMKNYDLMTLLSPNIKEKDRENIISWNGAMPKQDQYFSKVTNFAEIEGTINKANGK